MKTNFWTEEEDKILLEHYEEYGAAGLVDNFPDRTTDAVGKRAFRLGLRFKGENRGRRQVTKYYIEPVTLTITYKNEVLEGPRRVYLMDSERNHNIQKSHPVRKVSHGYSSCHSALEMAA